MQHVVSRPRENSRECTVAALSVALLALLRSEEHTSELQSQSNIVCRLLLEKKKLPTRLSTFGRNLDQRRRILRCLLLSPPFLFTISIFNLILTDSFSNITTMPQ